MPCAMHQPAQPEPIPAWWQSVRCRVWAVAPAWPAVLVATAYAVLMVWPDQVQDLALGADMDWCASDPRSAMFALWNIPFGLTLWFVARLLIAQYRPPPAGLPTSGFCLQRIAGVAHGPALWLPRLLSVMPALIAAAAFLAARQRAISRPLYLGPILYQLAGAVVVLAFVLARRPVLARIVRAWPVLHPLLQPRSAVVADFHGLSEMMWLARIFGGFWIATALGFTLWSFWPVAMGHALGPFVVLSIGLIGITVGLGACAFAQRNWHAPVFAAVGALAVLASILVDNHRLPRVLQSEPPPDTTLAAAYRDFGRHTGDDHRLLLIATAGGGIRAAYWTAYALGQLHDAHPKALDRRLFAISGVSGGGVGAVFYRALLKAAATNGGTVCVPRATGHSARSVADCAADMLSRDGIGPSLTAMLFTDLLQRFWPLSVLPDRARALGAAWENSWNNDAVPKTTAYPGSGNYLGQPFSQLWPDPADPFPILLLNGTSVATGRRIITTNLDLGQGPVISGVFHDVRAFPLKYPISAATAALNTARFPFISPPGSIPAIAPAAGGTVADAHPDQIIDGGVFENSGAQTINELLDWLVAQDGANGLDIFVLQITSDPTEAATDQPNCTNPHLALSSDKPATILPDLTSAAIGLLRSRAARGVAAMAALQTQIRRGGAHLHFAEIRLNALDDRANAPLGWTLSRQATRTIQGSWPGTATGGCNQAAVHQLIDWLGPE